MNLRTYIICLATQATLACTATVSAQDYAQTRMNTAPAGNNDRDYEIAAEITDSVTLNFRQSKINLDNRYMDNAESMEHIAKSLQVYSHPDSLYRLQRVRVIGAASPEGTLKFNEWLSRKRADAIFNYVGTLTDLPDSLTSFTFVGPDWEGARAKAAIDPSMPAREKTVLALDRVIEARQNGNRGLNQAVSAVKTLNSGVPYRYMYRNYFPRLRESKIYLDYVLRKPVERPVTNAVAVMPDTVVVHDTVYVPNFIYVPKCCPRYWALTTNMLMDALMIPNIGFDIYLGKNFSIAASWGYAWWSRDKSSFYWRYYGGEVDLRYWFGKQAHEKPLTGFHAGIYGQVMTYDFEFGKKGYMGGRPHKNIFNHPSWAAGVEFGYSLPIARRLNIDFEIGLGYMGGEYQVYKPNEDGGYQWYYTKNRKWWGPTKGGITLVWLLGCDNVNKNK